MIARRDVWCDPEVEELAKRFVPSADEVHGLQRRNDPEGELFRKIAEQGHYAGRTTPTDTRQGTYAAAPSGVLLASINSNDPRRMADMLRRALKKWDELSDDDRRLPDGWSPDRVRAGRTERFYPTDGLVLKTFSRDLPRDPVPRDWRAHAWNQDFAWFRKSESRSFLPERIAAGASCEVPKPLANRIAMTCLVDNVRGQTTNYPERAIRTAWLIVKVESVVGGSASLRLVGRMEAEERGKWAVAGFKDMNSPGEQSRGYSARLYGTAAFDIRAERFTRFDLVSLGTRWGATQYNGRADDISPAPIGHFLTMAGDGPEDRVAPAHFWAYGWK